jgi:hypothetical protein
VDPYSGTPTSITTVPASGIICSGSSATLTLNGGGGGTGEVIHWYSGSCGGTAVNTGNGIVVSPTVTTTYYGRYEDPAPCSYNSPCQSVTITVDNTSSNPASITPATTICNGSSTTLTLYGGGGGTGAVLTWWTGSCGGAVAGTGNNFVVSPGATTTYYGGYVDACGHTTTCQSEVVTVDAISGNPTGASASANPICPGGSTNLTLTGGGGGTGAIVNWYTGSCGGTLVGTGSPLSVSPGTTTTYYGGYVDACGHVTTCQSVTVTVTTGTGQIGMVNNGAIIYINGSATIYIAGGVNGNYWNYPNCAGTAQGSITSAGTVELEGSWYNDATNNVYATDAGTTILNGGTQSIGGTKQTDFFKLTLLSAGTKTLNINTQVGGTTTTTGFLELFNSNPILALNSYTLTITNPATTAIVYLGGCIESETYNGGSSTAAGTPQNTCTSFVQWNIGTSGAGNTYTIPFGTAIGTYLPFSATITTVGTGSGNLLVSTYHTSALNYPYPGYPNLVTNMHNPGGADNSAECIKRFWSVNLAGYTSAPTTTLAFYFDAANDNPSALSVPGLFAQYWSSTKWVTPGVGTGTAPNYVNAVTGVNFSGEWVLVNSTTPLPVELLNFSASCLDDKIKLLWSTASETNNDYFSVDRSLDNNSWEFVTRVNGAGNSNSIINYAAYDDFPYVQTLLGNKPAYYRMKQVDFNGNSKLYGPVVATCAETPGIDFDIVTIKTDVIDNEISVIYTAPANGERITACLFNMIGQQLMQQEQISSFGNNTITFSNIGISRAIYLIRLDNTEKFITRKILIP